MNEIQAIPDPRGVVPFSALRKGATASVGGKAANLGELTSAGLPVPPGFVVTAQAYLAAMEVSGARAKLRALAASVPVDDPLRLASTCAELRELVRAAGFAFAPYCRRVDITPC